MSCLLFPPWFILNQAEIIPTDRLSRHLLHIEITTTFVVYMPHTQVCVAAEWESCRLQAFCGYFYTVQQLLLQEKKKREFCRPLKREFVHCWLPLYAELWTPPPPPYDPFLPVPHDGNTSRCSAESAQKLRP